jgi:hypothetical protein
VALGHARDFRSEAGSRKQVGDCTAPQHSLVPILRPRSWPGRSLDLEHFVAGSAAIERLVESGVPTQ